MLWTVNTVVASASVVHASAAKVASVSSNVKFNGWNCNVAFIWYPPLKTTSPGKQGAVELAISPFGEIWAFTIGPNCL